MQRRHFLAMGGPTTPFPASASPAGMPPVVLPTTQRARWPLWVCALGTAVLVLSLTAYLFPVLEVALGGPTEALESITNTPMDRYESTRLRHTDLVFGARAAELWVASLRSCSIVWHVHVPKTAGTSIYTALRERSPRFVEFTGRQTYSAHGRRHNWRRPDLLREGERRGGKGSSWMRGYQSPYNSKERQVVVSAETAMGDLVRRKYPWFDHTCFFAVVREPHEWVLSAENHMRSKEGNMRGINGTKGFFDHANLQRFVVGSNRDKRGVTTCITTVDHVQTLLAPLMEDTALPMANTNPHPRNRTKELEEVVRQKYAEDLELWNLVSDNQFVCW